MPPVQSNVPDLDYYAGLDLGQKRDHSVVAVVLKKDGHYSLTHMHVFLLGTEYTDVLSYLKQAAKRFRTIRRWTIDQTGVGEPFPELARKIGLKNVVGVELSMPRKQDVMTNLKQVMEQRRLHFRRDRELVNEIGGEIAELTAMGKTKFSHRSGTHDDRLWALGLAVYGGRFDVEHYKPAITFGNAVNPWRLLTPPSTLSRFLRKGPYNKSGLPYPWPPPRS